MSGAARSGHRRPRAGCLRTTVADPGSRLTVPGSLIPSSMRLIYGFALAFCDVLGIYDSIVMDEMGGSRERGKCALGGDES